MGPSEFESLTPSLSGTCSNQLSYGPRLHLVISRRIWALSQADFGSNVGEKRALKIIKPSKLEVCLISITQFLSVI